MNIKSNYSLSTLLGISHFCTDAMAAFVLTSISYNIIQKHDSIIDTSVGISVIGFFILYNFIAFFGQIFVGYFLDIIKDNNDFFSLSKKVVIWSFIFYILGVISIIFSYFIAVILIGIGSCLFHLGSGNITLLSNNRKATHLGIFASGGVLGLSFGGFIALFSPKIVIILIFIICLIAYQIYKNNQYVIEKEIKISEEEINISLHKLLPIILGFLAIVLILRSTIWTHYQSIFVGEVGIIFYIAIAAFLGKITGGLLEDSNFFKRTYFIILGIISVILLGIYNIFPQNISLLLFGIFGIQVFISPITLMIYKLIPTHRAKIIGFVFGLSLVLGFVVLQFI